MRKAREGKVVLVTGAGGRIGRPRRWPAIWMSDRAAGVSGQIFAIHMNKTFLMSQPRPVRSVHSGEGWTAETIAEHAIPALKSHFTPPEVSADVFSWDPV